MADDQWKAEAKRRIRASIAHLSNTGKYDRERWVVERLVSRLGVHFAPDEFTPAVEPADVAFRDARFQVKELLDADRRRLDEYRNDLERLEAATSPAEMFTQYEPRDLTIADAAARVKDRAASLREKYGPHERLGLDLLVYVNLLGVELVDEGVQFAITEPPGFRSISFVAGGMASVLWADESAPEFLRRNTGRVGREAESS